MIQTSTSVHKEQVLRVCASRSSVSRHCIGVMSCKRQITLQQEKQRKETHAPLFGDKEVYPSARRSTTLRKEPSAPSTQHKRAKNKKAATTTTWRGAHAKARTNRKKRRSQRNTNLQHVPTVRRSRCSHEGSSARDGRSGTDGNSTVPGDNRLE